MFLDKLEILHGEKIIRSIKFHKGLNLIVDQTKNSDKKSSGNNVGKTTVLRLIDFCLGGEGKNIYIDPEFKKSNKSNTKIENFLKDNNIIATLILKEKLEDKFSKEVRIRRNFLSRKDKIQEINGRQFGNDEFSRELFKAILDTELDKPTFRQVISKNIRYEKKRLDNTVRVLHDTTTNDQYEALYLFWLGVSTDNAQKKQALLNQKKFEEKVVRKLGKEYTESHIHQALDVIARNIDDLEVSKRTFTTNKNYESDIQSLSQLKQLRNELTTRMGTLTTRRMLILETKEELEKTTTKHDIGSLEIIYKEAKRFLPKLHRSFEDLVHFHNSMIDEKVSYVTKEIPSIDKQLETLREELAIKSKEIEAIASKLHGSNVVEDFSKIIEKLNDHYEQKGCYEEKLRQWEKSKNSIQTIDDQLQAINDEIFSQEKSIEDRLKSLNSYFSRLSQMLYGEQFIVSLRKNDHYSLEIDPVSGNLGTGKKKGQIAAFDFAYIQFCEANDLTCLHFILHDQLEMMHDNQLDTLSTIANETNSQFILPILRDKLPSCMVLDAYQVLLLSQEDKLFKVSS
jgi:uncharacterized protein YydD (DUF2326 family)